MIDVTGNTAKQRLLREMTLLQQNLETSFAVSIGTIFSKQFRKAAKLVEDTRISDYVYAVDSERNNFVDVLRKQYRKIWDVFFDRLFSDVQKMATGYEFKSGYEKKDFIDEFWNEMNTYIGREALKKVQWMDATTKKTLRLLINKGLEEGKSYNEIAKDIRKSADIQKVWRAKRIARTETHTAANHSLQTAAKTTRLIQEKEWFSARDSRTRRKLFNHFNSYPRGANGERIRLDAMFQGTGESLSYPGDSRGSAGNVVNCRCMELFHTKIAEVA